MSKPFADFSKYPSLRSASTQPLGILLTEYIGKHFALRVSLRIHSAKVTPCLASKIGHQLHPLTVWVGRAQSCLRGLATGSRFTACTAKQPSALPSARHVASVNVCSVKSLVALGKLSGVRQRCSQWQAELLGTAITLSSATFSAPSHGRRSTLSVADPVLVQYPMGQNQSVPQPVAPETKPATSACYSASQKLPPEPRAKLNSARSKIGDINNPVTYGGRCAAVWLRRTTLD